MRACPHGAYSLAVDVRRSHTANLTIEYKAVCDRPQAIAFWRGKITISWGAEGLARGQGLEE